MQCSVQLVLNLFTSLTINVLPFVVLQRQSRLITAILTPSDRTLTMPSTCHDNPPTRFFRAALSNPAMLLLRHAPPDQNAPLASPRSKSTDRLSPDSSVTTGTPLEYPT